MVKQNNLWIFGQSHCLPYSLQDQNAGWDQLLAKKLGYSLKNFARPGADNLFIFYSILENIGKIMESDIVVVGWSHPSRKTFIMDKNQSNKLKNYSLIYKTRKHKFLRSKGHPRHSLRDTMKKWFNMKPKQSGIDFYDTWYNDYFNLQEQKINFQSYLLSARQLLSNNVYVPFYFSVDSTKNLKNVSKNMCVAEFVQRHSVAISKLNAHMNNKGHKLWAKKLYKEVKKNVIK